MSLDDIEDALYTATRAVVGDPQLRTSELIAAIRDRSARYTSDRTKLAKPASTKADLAARAVFFSVTDAPKIAIPIAELAAQDALPATRPLRVVDLGAGCGAMSLGLVEALAPADIAITAIDRDRDALGIALAALRAIAPTVVVTTRVDDATSAPIPSCDLVVIGTMLNELATDAARLALVERALSAITDDGAVIIIEPALRDTTRALHTLRDALLTRNKVHVFAPCTRQSAPCPALADPTDWCHEHRSVGAAPKLPPRTHELARLTHLRDDGLKFSYLVLRKAPRATDAWRIVGTPWQQKGKLEALACGEPGRVTLRLLKRHRAPGNRAIESVAKGHVVRVEAPLVDERVEITDATRVEIVFPRT